jgi:hypothetical protein
MGHNSVQVVQPVEKFYPCRVIMPRLYFCLRLVAVAVAIPFIGMYVLACAVAHLLGFSRQGTRPARVALRQWMSVCDWVKGIPVGYSYWEQYEAPVMLDQIVVHHDD